MTRSSARVEPKRGLADQVLLVPALVVLTLVTGAVLAGHVVLGGAIPFARPLASLGWRLLWAAADH